MACARLAVAELTSLRRPALLALPPSTPRRASASPTELMSLPLSSLPAQADGACDDHSVDVGVLQPEED
jgi:hypothetical protein